MLTASSQYKEHMKTSGRLRNQTYIRVTIGLINQQAQSSAFVPKSEQCTYYSNLKWPLDNYEVKELYATCDQDYTTLNSKMYFLPRTREDVVLNQGIVSEELMGPVEIRFPVQYDIKGLTIEFGKAYPVDFIIESNNNVVSVTGNTKEHFVTEEIFEGATFLRFVPSVMVNGKSRFRIHKITMGIGIYFDNQRILSATKKEHISPVMEELPTIDFSLTVNNKDRAFDIENEESSVNFLEIGQGISVLYGQELDDGSVEWLPGAKVRLKEWSADDEQMNFSASDRFEYMDGTYHKGLYRPDGISLYDLAIDVFSDAGVDKRTYWIDSYLKSVKVTNPMPVVAHKEALQLIANAGRCILYQDREGNIFLKSSFIPDMESSSDNEAYFSHAGSVLDKAVKKAYAMTTQDYTSVAPTQYFLPRQGEGESYLNVGYVSESVAGSDGFFAVNPALEINLEASFKCFGLTLEFGSNNPAQMVFHVYHDGELVEDYKLTDLTATTIISHEFEEFDKLVVEFTKGYPNNRVVLNNIAFGDRTDYVFEYGNELTKTPKGTQLPKVREFQVIRTLYNQAGEKKELAKETIAVTASDNRYTFYFSNPSYDLSCELTETGEGQTATIVDSSNYFATVEFIGVTGIVEVSITGREYTTVQTKVSRQLNPTGKLEVWENPLVSDTVHGANLADWIGDYMKADREYDLQYRGEPRLDANDIAFLENKYVPDLLLRVYDHTLKFNGALSGTIKARRDMSNVATAKD
ncbi:hypothetical protein [Clostridium sp. E02]|uniref:hypothetical protein n=1 Tax=Clostridium sp. E02 TaxID=2487134 RepID=UPI000F52EC30|nr:hypothetical protein [Clostridium sp. E02]